MQIDNEFEKINEMYIRRAAEIMALKSSIGSYKKQVEQKDREINIDNNSMDILNEFLNSTRMKLINDFEGLITKGLREIFEKEYTFKIKYSTHGNSMIAELYVILPDGKEINLNVGEGGGIKDFISVISRILYLMMEPSNPYKIIFLDENLKHMDKERAKKAFIFIQNLTKQLDIQVLFITHMAGIKELGNDFNIITLE